MLFFSVFTSIVSVASFLFSLSLSLPFVLCLFLSFPHAHITLSLSLFHLHYNVFNMYKALFTLCTPHFENFPMIMLVSLSFSSFARNNLLNQCVFFPFCGRRLRRCRCLENKEKKKGIKERQIKKKEKEDRRKMT